MTETPNTDFFDKFESEYSTPTLQTEAERSKIVNALGDVMKQFSDPSFGCGFQEVWIRAYTPSFNDGSPCEFTLGDVTIDGETGWDSLGNIPSNSLYAEGSPLPTVNRTEGYYILAKRLRKLIESCEKAFEERFGTNWTLLIQIFHGEVRWEIGGYDCGY